MKHLLLLAAVVLAATTAYAQKAERKSIYDGELKDNVYANEGVGWVMTVPQGYEIVNEEGLRELKERGAKAIEEMFDDDDFNLNSVRYLLNFRRGQIPMFNSMIEPFKESKGHSFEDNYKIVSAALYEAFINQGLDADTATTYEKIDGMPFHVFNITLYDAGGTELAKQKCYTRMHTPNTIFSAILTYSNEEDGDEMLQAWKGSKFKK